MKVIIDCNVLIAAGIKNATCRAVLRYTLQHCTIYLSEAILLEYLSVIRRNKFKDYYNVLEELAILLSDAAVFIQGAVTTYTLPDPKDIIYLQAAAAAQAHYVITGNIKDFPEAFYHTTNIISPGDFYKLF